MVEEDLCYFQNLACLDLSDNKVKLEQLKNLKNLVELNLSYNQISRIGNINPETDFILLENLSLAYNNLKLNDLSLLTFFRRLKYLDLTAN